MKQKPITPYARLLAEFKSFCDDVFYRQQKPMFLYPKNKLNESWSLSDLYERTAAAKQLGYDVVISAQDNGLAINYIKQLPSRPWNTK